MSYFNKPFTFDLEQEVKNNAAYRWVVDTTPQMQLIFMCLLCGENVPLETHSVTQFIYVICGCLELKMCNCSYILGPGHASIIPPGVAHYISNNGPDPVKLYTIYAMPLHAVNELQIRQNDCEEYLEIKT